AELDEARAHHEAEAELDVQVEQHRVRAGRQLRRRPPQLLVVEDADAVDGADARGVEAREGARVADAVRGGNLGRVQGTGIPDLRAGERAAGREQRLAEQRVRTHDLVDERAYLRILGDERVGQTSDQRRDARLFRIREPDPEVETEGRRD